MHITGQCTATIGSFPLEDTERNRSRVLEDLINLKIDFPNYPQLTGMGEQFLDDIAKGVAEPGMEPYNWAISYLERKHLINKVKLKACLTGPFSLSTYINLEESTTQRPSLPHTALMDKSVVHRLTEQLTKTCKALSRKASMIYIDEPILSVVFGKRHILYNYTEADVIHSYNRLREACGEVYVGTHICGRISQLLANTLLETDLDILSHEFFDTPRNFSVYSPEKLKEKDKILSIGCVSTKNPRVESIIEIQSLVKKARKKYDGPLIFTPDCGFKNLIIEDTIETSYETAIRKLQNMVQALKKGNVF